MRSRFPLIALAVVLCVAATAGCSRRTTSLVTGAGNQPPVVRLERPAPGAGAEEHRLAWTGTDLDGRVDHYEITTDPNAIATGVGAWERTESRSHILHARPAITAAISGRRTSEPRFFGVRAVDDQGAVSEVAARAFVGDNVAPQVQIVAPQATPVWVPLLVNGATVRWEGVDPDARTGKPLEYRYLLLDQNSSFPISLALQDPDSLRRFYAPDFEGWTSVGHKTELTIEGLAEQKQYLLVVIAIDEAGDATALFSRGTNMLLFDLVHPGTHGPILSVFGAVTHQMVTGGTHDDPATAPRFDVPADKELTVQWSGTPPPTQEITGYRWALDPKNPGDPGSDQTRGDWSKWSLVATSATFTLASGTEHRLYIEVQDNGGLVTRLLILMNAVGTSFDRDLLIVDDTRMIPDQVINGVYQLPSGAWPTAAELDTFLYARGGVPWRGAYTNPAYGGPYTSSPGIFNGYSFDTLGTRSTLQTNPVTLELLGRYRHVIWMVDQVTANMSNAPWSPTAPSSWLAWDSRPLASYIQAGGKVWLVGACGYATMKSHNHLGTDPRVFSDYQNELVPGTFVYDYPHWRSELTTGGLTDQLGRSDTRYASFPEYVIPKQRGVAEDNPPPLRLPDSFWYRQQTTVEFISRPNVILESGVSVLDTVYQAPLRNSSNPGPFPAMTVYRGSECGQVVMTGVDIWGWSRSSCVGLVEGVLQGIWGLQRDPGAPRVASTEVLQESAGRRRRR